MSRVVTILLLVAALVLAGCGGNGSGGPGSTPTGGEVETSPSGQSESGSSNTSETGEGNPAEGTQAEAARCYVDAVNSEDLDVLVGCFDPDGTVVDVSRRVEGRQAIREWAANEVVGGTLRVIESEPRPNGVRLLVYWAPAGSDGWRANYTFEIRNKRIVVADLQYA